MIDYIIIGLLVITIILIIISLSKNINEGNITERLGKLEVSITKDLSDLKRRLGNIVIGYNKDGKEVKAKDLKSQDLPKLKL